MRACCARSVAHNPTRERGDTIMHEQYEMEGMILNYERMHTICMECLVKSG